MVETAPQLADVVRAERLIKPHLFSTHARRMQRPLGPFWHRDLRQAGEFAAHRFFQNSRGDQSCCRAGRSRSNSGGNRISWKPRPGCRVRGEPVWHDGDRRRAGDGVQRQGSGVAAYGYRTAHAWPIVRRRSAVDARIGACFRYAGSQPVRRGRDRRPGTVGYEFVRDVPDLDVMLVPVGAGGLLAGCLTAAKRMNPGQQVIGVQQQTRHRWWRLLTWATS